MILRPLLLILAAVVAHGVTAGYHPIIKRTKNSGAVHDYLEKVLPTSKDVLLHELMGPKIGADVSCCHSPLNRTHIMLFLFCLARRYCSHHPRSRNSSIHDVLAQRWLSCILHLAQRALRAWPRRRHQHFASTSRRCSTRAHQDPARCQSRW